MKKSPRMVIMKQARLAAAVAAVLSMSTLTPGFARAAGAREAFTAMPDKGDGRCARLMARLDEMDKNLSPDQVRDIVAGRLAKSGEKSLKVGKASEIETGGVAVEIVTATGSLVTTQNISTKTGWFSGIEKRCAMRMAARDGQPGEEVRQRDFRGPGNHGKRMDRSLFRRFTTLAMLGGEHRHDLGLSTDQVKKLADAALIMTGNPRLKVGAVKEVSADAISVDIITVDNALVLNRMIDRHNGRVQPPD